VPVYYNADRKTWYAMFYAKDYKGVNKNTGYDVNAKIKEGNRRVLFKNMIYIADGPSDVPAFSLIKNFSNVIKKWN